MKKGKQRMIHLFKSKLVIIKVKQIKMIVSLTRLKSKIKFQIINIIHSIAHSPRLSRPPNTMTWPKAPPKRRRRLEQEKLVPMKMRSIHPRQTRKQYRHIRRQMKLHIHVLHLPGSRNRNLHRNLSRSFPSCLFRKSLVGQLGVATP